MSRIRATVSAVAVMAALFATPGAVMASPLTASDATFALLDKSATTRNLTIAGFGTIADVNITITFAKCNGTLTVNPTVVEGPCLSQGFSFNSDIIFRLISPGGTIVNLVQNSYSGQIPGAGSQTVTFDDAAASAVGGPAVLTGSFRPVGLLSAFNGLEANGIWALHLEDDLLALPGAPLTYFRSTLNIETTAAAVPEPATLSLLGLGLVLAGARLARRKNA